MKIREVRAAGLHGATPGSDWSLEIDTERCVRTLVAVITDAGLVEIGSANTSDELVRAAVQVLAPS